jgi:hypothetical protein
VDRVDTNDGGVIGSERLAEVNVLADPVAHRRSLYGVISSYKTVARFMVRAQWQRMTVDGGTTEDAQRWRLFYPAHPYDKRTEL